MIDDLKRATMDGDVDFRTLSDQHLVEILAASIHEFDDPSMAQKWPTGSILKEIDRGLAKLFADRDAVALVRPKDWDGKGMSVLWLLFVKPNFRGKGVGKAFMTKLHNHSEFSPPMRLHCKGNDRKAFFLQCGFREEASLADGIYFMAAY